MQITFLQFPFVRETLTRMFDEKLYCKLCEKESNHFGSESWDPSSKILKIFGNLHLTLKTKLDVSLVEVRDLNSQPNQQCSS